MSKYSGLSQHLLKLSTDEWVTTFKEIEQVIGNALPPSAYQYQAWWSNQAGGQHIQSASWKSAGWRTGNLDLSAQRVTFFREKKVRPEPHHVSDTTPSSSDRGLSIAQAKAGLAAHFGVPADSIEIIIKG